MLLEVKKFFSLGDTHDCFWRFVRAGRAGMLPRSKLTEPVLVGRVSVNGSYRSAGCDVMSQK
jgi:hypothetical protein